MNTLPEIISVIVVGLIGGIAVGLQGPMSGAISAKLGPLGSSLIIHVGGALVSGVLLMFAGGINLRELQTVPKPYLMAGVFGVVLYVTLAFTLPRVGGTVSIALLILAEMVVTVILDHFGWLGLPQHSFNLVRALGIALIVGGVWLVTQ